MHAYRVTPVETLGLFVDAEDYYREFYRAAKTAKKSVVMSGWQFDSEVCLLRGEAAKHADGPVTLLAYLNSLCEKNPDLHVYILAWDFHLIFAAEREWMQELVFKWSSNERLHFQFDSSHVDGASHHQKFVTIDGELSFVGGLDLCEDRWDDKHHRAHNPLRISRGKPHKPFHDIQSFARGREFTAAVNRLFQSRWLKAGGEAVPDEVLSPPVAPSTHEVNGLRIIAATEAAIARTDPHGVPDGPVPALEILQQYQQAIAGAQRLIYVETQYMSSHAFTEALCARMKAGGPALQIVLMLNMRGETLKETAAVGLAQAKNIGMLRECAQQTRHDLGIYYTLPACENGESPAQATYVHAKLMIVDDRWLTVGSANLTNRSFAVDTELNVTVQADDASDALGQSIATIRRELTAEHTGGDELPQIDGLVKTLEAMAEKAAAGQGGAACRLRRHPSPTEGEQTAISLLDPQLLPFDPDHVEKYDDEERADFITGLELTVKQLLGVRDEKA